MTTTIQPIINKPRRGRKQDDSLPPSRARDVQRAFRARRAAHLANLEARNSWLENENTELRRRLGMGEDDPPISGPEPELLPLGSPGGSSRGEETLVKSEEDTSPPLFNWDEHHLAGADKGKEKDSDHPPEVHSWNARRLEGIPPPNALGFEFPSHMWGGGGGDGARPNGAVQASPTQQRPPSVGGGGGGTPFQLLPPPHQMFESNPLSYLANLPLTNFAPPPHHAQTPGHPHYEAYHFSWPPPQQRSTEAQVQNVRQAY
ncbi:hypothetical protein JCM3765_003368 [Sporobolomyces pararoseus]